MTPRNAILTLTLGRSKAGSALLGGKKGKQCMFKMSVAPHVLLASSRIYKVFLSFV